MKKVVVWCLFSIATFCAKAQRLFIKQGFVTYVNNSGDTLWNVPNGGFKVTADAVNPLYTVGSGAVATFQLSQITLLNVNGLVRPVSKSNISSGLLQYAATGLGGGGGGSATSTAILQQTAIDSLTSVIKALTATNGTVLPVTEVYTTNGNTLDFSNVNYVLITNEGNSDITYTEGIATYKIEAGGQQEFKKIFNPITNKTSPLSSGAVVLNALGSTVNVKKFY